MQVKQIIKELMKVLDCRSQRVLAFKINRNPAIITAAIKENRLSPKLIENICAKFPQINREYLETGKGKILLPDSDPRQAMKSQLIEMIRENFNRLTPDVQVVLLESFKKILEDNT